MKFADIRLLWLPGLFLSQFFVLIITLGANQAAASPAPVPLPFNALYLRCNASDWELSARSQLQRIPGTSELALDFEVKDEWMLQSGDSCVLTETPTENAWAPWQRNYTLTEALLRAPDSAPIQFRTASSLQTFRVIYPERGTYRAVYNVQDGYLSIQKLGPIDSGEVSWSLPGNLSLDNEGRLFLETRYPTNSLMRVDPASGKVMWKFRAAEFFSQQKECSDAKRIVVLEKYAVQALDSVTGRELWHFDLRGEQPDASAVLSCSSESQVLLLIHGRENELVTALNKSSGKELWTYKGESFVSVQGREGDTIYLSSFEDNVSRLVGIAKKHGRKLWSKELDKAWFNFDPQGALYVLEGSDVVRLASTSGQELWRFKSDADWIFLSFESGRTIVTDRDRILRLDPETGSILWSKNLQDYFGAAAFANVLKSGEILISSTDFVSFTYQSLVIDGDTGEVLWKNAATPSQSFVSQGAAGESFLVDGATLSALDIRTGSQRWSFALRADRGTPQSIFGPVVATDSKLFSRYGTSFGKSAAMGILALDPQSGQLLWQNFQDAPLAIVGSAAGHLFINVGNKGGSAKAIRL